MYYLQFGRRHFTWDPQNFKQNWKITGQWFPSSCLKLAGRLSMEATLFKLSFVSRFALSRVVCRASQKIITKIGKSNTVDYEVINNSDKDILITSTYNVTPQKAGLYFNKLDCFCYEERKVLAGQKILLPVTFFISPDIIDDPNTSELKSLTLSYTFFNVNNINVSNLY